MTSAVHRTFIAINVPKQVKDEIARVQELVRKSNLDRVSWTNPEGIHLTLKFLGEVHSDWIHEITSALRQVCNALPAFEVSTSRIGCFPSVRNPRVFFLGLSPNENLAVLKEAIEVFIEEVGFQKDDRAFHPHLTICRVKELANRSNLYEKFADIHFPQYKWNVEQVDVMKSELHPSGARYSLLENVILKKSSK